MNKILILALFSLLAVVVSATADNGQTEELEEVKENENNLEVSRMERDADPGKQNKNEQDNNAGKRNKNGKGKKKASKRNKNGKGKKKASKRNKNGKAKKKASKRNKNGKAKKKASKRNKNGKAKKKASKRNKNGKGKKKARKGKKNGKGYNTVKDNGRSVGCSRAVNSTCLDLAVKLLNLVNTKITNFLVQQKRITKYNSTGGKKSGKKGLFGPIASKVIDVGGGNASDLSCSGNKTNPGATKLKSIIASLQKCEADINTACDPTAYPLPNMTNANECKTNMESMKASVTACAKKKGDEACTCWFNSSLKATAEKVKKCDISGENKKVTAQHKACTGNFSACKKIEDTAVTYIYACSQSAADLKVKAAQTKANVDALGAAKNKTSTLAGSSSGRSTIIRKRATSVSTCSDFVTLSTTLLTIASDSPSSSTVATMAKILSAVSDALSCTTAEKSTLTTQVTTYTQTITKVSATYSGLKSSVEDASGTTSDAEIVAAGAAATASTKKVAAKRNRLVRNVLNNLN